MIDKIKEGLLNYLADDYLDKDWKKQEGQGNFNKGIEDKYKIRNFSLGNFRQIDKNFLLVQIKSVSGNKDDLLGQLGTVNFGTSITVNTYIEYDVKPSNCAYVSDLFIQTLYDRLQQFIYSYRDNLTPASPNITIEKYYSSSQGKMINFNSIDKLIIDADLSFDYKVQDLTLEEIL